MSNLVNAPSRLADRLLEAVHRRFVGREAPCALFESALTANTLPFFLIHVDGPGGLGKTTLLHEFRYRALQRTIPATYLDARTIEATPHAFIAALREALAVPPEASVPDLLATTTQRRVLLIDTFEHLASLERWLFTTFLPQLSDEVLVVVAERNPLSAVWRTDPGWQPLLRTISLRNLSPDASLAYFRQSGIPDDQHRALFQLTHGNPLALALIAAVAEQRPDQPLDLSSDPDIIKTLLDRFVMKVPSPAHRTALEACALVRYTTESLLGAMMDLDDAHALFEWLRGLSFIDSGNQGLFPHDLAREVLSADLQWRNPTWHRTLHTRARAFYKKQVTETTGSTQQRLLTDYIYLHRDNPIVQPFFNQLRSQGGLKTGVTLRPMDADADHETLVQMVKRHEGPASADLARYWMAEQPEGVLVVEKSDGTIGGFTMYLLLTADHDAEIKQDPATQAAWTYLQAHAPLRPGERLLFFRYWMAADTYQDISAIQSLLFIQAVRYYLTTPDLAFSLYACAQAELWAPLFAYADLPLVPEAGFKVGDQTYGVFGHDWRKTPPVVWLDVLAERETSSSTKPPPKPKAPPVLVLSQEAFAEAVHDALRAYARPHTLANNPLLRSRIVADQLSKKADDADRIKTLCDVLSATWKLLDSSPRLTKGHRALDRAYFRPAPSHEQAAELLDLPYSTFRRHLKLGVEELTALLWHRELGG